jgi:hypothetical protein
VPSDLADALSGVARARERFHRFPPSSRRAAETAQKAAQNINLDSSVKNLATMASS